MGLEDWERRRLAGETPALPGRRGGSTHSSREFSCPVAPLRRMGTYVGSHEKRGQDKLSQQRRPEVFRSWPRRTTVRRFVGRTSVLLSLHYSSPAAVSADSLDRALR